MIEEREIHNVSGGPYDQAGMSGSPYGLYEQPGKRRRATEWVGAHGGSILLSVVGTAIGGLLLWQGARALNRIAEEVEEPELGRGRRLLERAKSAVGRGGVANRLAERFEDAGEERRGGWLRRAKHAVEDSDIGDRLENARERMVDDDEVKRAGTFGKIAKALLVLAIFDGVRRTGVLKRLPKMSQLRDRLSSRSENESNPYMGGERVPEVR
jgi:hypothetical protein